MNQEYCGASCVRRWCRVVSGVDTAEGAFVHPVRVEKPLKRMRMFTAMTQGTCTPKKHSSSGSASTEGQPQEYQGPTIVGPS